MRGHVVRYGSVVAVLLLAFSVTALADTATFSDTTLAGLKYRGGADYVANSPGYASLSTPDSGLYGTDPVVYVTNSMATLGDLDAFSGNFTSSNFSGPAGTAPYWVIWLSDNNCATYPSSDCIMVLGMGGPTINGSSAIHVVDPAGNVTDYWGQSLSSIYNVSYNGTTLGNMPIYEVGVEIGDWNVPDTISASVEIDSITTNPVPEPASLLMFGTGILGLVGAMRRKLLL